MISVTRTLAQCGQYFKKLSSHCIINSKSILPICGVNEFHKSAQTWDLFEFFDKKDNWGATEVKVGRAWKLEELRIKSNADLHKLWFVLLKERNMLLTMEHESKEQVKLFPNPERIDKVKESMENLESVVRERNRAYFELETGETGERPAIMRSNPLGLRHYYRMREHLIPKHMNISWHTKQHTGFCPGAGVAKFLRVYREKLSVAKKKEINRQRNHVFGLLKRFPHLDTAMLEEKYPQVDIKAARLNKKARGNHEFNTA